jgi:integrase
MANLNVTIVIRTTDAEGKRRWVKATGKKTDPSGTLYLRYCVGSDPKYIKAGDTFQEAEVAKIRLGRRLKIESLGGTVPEEVPAAKSHRCDDLLNSYVAWLRTTRKRNGRQYVISAIAARESDINAFLKHSGCTHVEQITRTVLLNYKDFLYAEEMASDTVLNKLICVTSWLRRNQIVSITGVLKPEDFPTQKVTQPNPYHKKEIDAMMKVAGKRKLLLRFFRATGMRKGEVAHAEKSDLNPLMNTIRVQPKPKFGWVPKTVKGERDIKISRGLMADLMALPDGLLFPNEESGKPERHYERIIKEIALEAGVVAAPKADWCHRWRDTFATEQVRMKIHDLRDIARMMGHSDMKTIDLYAEFCRMDSEEAEQAAEKQDPDGKKDETGIHVVGKSNAA